MTFFRGVLWNTLTLMNENFFSLLFTFILARYLSISDFGIYSYIRRIITNISVFFNSIGNFSFNYFFQKNKKKREEVFYTIQIFTIFFSVVILILLIHFTKHISPSDINNFFPFYIGFGLLLFFTLFQQYSETLNALFEFKKKFFIKILRSIIQLILLLILIVLKKIELKYIFFLLYITLTLMILISHYLVKDEMKKIILSFALIINTIRLLYKKASYFLLAVFLNLLLNVLIYIFLAKFSNSKAIGIFSYNLYFTMIFNIAGGGIAKTLLPFTSKRGKNISTNLWISNYAIIYISFIIISFLFFVYDFVIKEFFKKEILFWEGKISFLILAFAFLFKLVSGNFGVVLNGLGKTEDSFKISLFTLLAFVTISIPLTQHLFTLGMSISLLFVYLFQLIIGYIYLRRNLITHSFYSPYFIVNKILSKINE